MQTWIKWTLGIGTLLGLGGLAFYEEVIKPSAVTVVVTPGLSTTVHVGGNGGSTVTIQFPTGATSTNVTNNQAANNTWTGLTLSTNLLPDTITATTWTDASGASQTATVNVTTWL